ncbi:hypothetical protein EJB05_07666 [Eragrostis curvula]|uniref:Small ribosomal subunit protein eS1 n=1 Tax=Eragrostis curvula TaxID=38414 RepID=A0A5J9WLA6_9POAL|nr:hypothetical protein EJB05_07666 [Eragrostis curvula]
MSYYNPHAHVVAPPPQGYPMEAYGNGGMDGHHHHQPPPQYHQPPAPAPCMDGHHQYSQQGQYNQYSQQGAPPSPPMGYPAHPYPPQPYGYAPPPQPYPPYAQPPPPPPPRNSGPSFCQGWCGLTSPALKGPLSKPYFLFDIDSCFHRPPKRPAAAPPPPPSPLPQAPAAAAAAAAATMAVGKNKRISKGKKGGKKKTVDPFAKKDWYDIKAPSVFSVRNIGKTLVSRTQGTKIASEGLKHRVFEVSLADLQSDEDQAYRKIRLRAEDVQGKNVLTNFWGMDFTTDKLRSLVKKWQTLIEAHVDVKTTDGYMLRLFCIGFTKRRPNQVKRTCYAQSSQIRQIRRKMVEIMASQASTCDLKELVSKFIPEVIGKEIEKATSSIFPLQNVFIRKVKILKAPKFDLGKLMEVHGDYKEDVGVKLERPAEGDETMATPEVAAE